MAALSSEMQEAKKATESRKCRSGHRPPASVVRTSSRQSTDVNLARVGPTTPKRAKGSPLALWRPDWLSCRRTLFVAGRLSPSTRERPPRSNSTEKLCRGTKITLLRPKNVPAQSGNPVRFRSQRRFSRPAGSLFGPAPPSFGRSPGKPARPLVGKPRPHRAGGAAAGG
jgi:hypothetical protein